MVDIADFEIPKIAMQSSNFFFSPPDGCVTNFTCGNAAEYAAGMTGAQIISAFNTLFQIDKVVVCGNAYLRNGYVVTVNASSGCKNVGI